MTGRGRARRRAGRTALWPVLMFGCLAACSPGTDTAAQPASTATVTTETITTGTITTGVSATVTSTIPGATILAVPPAQTPEPAPVDGTCPYLSDDDVADINGQHTGTTQVVEVSPHPICLFYRSDGGFLASVRVIQAETPQAAVAAVNAHVPIENSNPANQPPGWAGGSKVTDAGSVYAVSKDSIAVVAETNQQQSIKGRQLVVATVGALGL